MSSGRLLGEEVAIYSNMTSVKANLFGTVLMGSAIFNGVVLVAMLGYTYFFTNADNMKTCEKLIVYNALVPDLVLEVLVGPIFARATINGIWSYSKYVTQWLAFLHTVCVFHSNLAISFICYIIALSMRDVVTFECANNIKNMSLLIVSTLSLTTCFCSLPATERRGYMYMTSWLSPWFNIRYQFGSLFMLVALFGIILPLDLSSALQLFMSKQKLKQEVEVTQRALKDINKVIIFTLVSALIALLTLPMSIGMNNVDTMLVFRLMVYMSPLARVLSLLYTCPHFQFGISSITQQDMDEFAKLGEENIQVTPEALEDIIEEIQHEEEAVSTI